MAHLGNLVLVLTILAGSSCWSFDLAEATAASCRAHSGDEAVGIYGFVDMDCEERGSGLGCFRDSEESRLICRLCKSINVDRNQPWVDCPEGVDPNLNQFTERDITPSMSQPVAPPVKQNAPSASTMSPILPSASPLPTMPPLKQGSRRNYLFRDDFDRLNNRVWKHEITMAGGGNWEFQLYRNNRTNSFTKDGILYIKPTLTTDWLPDLNQGLDMNGLTPESDCTSNAFYGCVRHFANPISSARISTRDFAFTYGTLEVSAKLPAGDWLWPAIWLLPKYEQYGGWPASGEIDLLESTGNKANSVPDKGGRNAILSALHWGTDWQNNRIDQTFGRYTLPDGEDFSQNFHTFGLVWYPGGIRFYVDKDVKANRVMEVTWSNEEFFKRGGWDPAATDNPWEGGTNGAPFDQRFRIIINLAVGGNSFFPDGDYGDYRKPWDNDSDQMTAEFWNAKDEWYPTWQPPNDPSFAIDWIEVRKEWTPN